MYSGERPDSSPISTGDGREKAPRSAEKGYGAGHGTESNNWGTDDLFGDR
jgi:hypothetical protein